MRISLAQHASDRYAINNATHATRAELLRRAVTDDNMHASITRLCLVCVIRGLSQQYVDRTCNSERLVVMSSEEEEELDLDQMIDEQDLVTSQKQLVAACDLIGRI